jgi:signal transduction histidine kinase
MKTFSLSRKVFMAFALVFAATMAVEAVSSAWRISQNLSAQYTSKGTAIATGIATSSVEIILFRDLSTVQALIDQYLEIEGVAYVMVVEPQGEVLAHTFTPEVPDEVRGLERSSQTVTQDLHIAGLGDFLNVKSPILAGKIGYVNVGMDRKHIQSAVWEACLRQIALLLVMFLLGLFLMRWLMYQIVDPLNHLTRHAKLLAAGSPGSAASSDVWIAASRTDEVGQLARALRHMVDELSQREEELRKAHDELEVRVQERTAELQQVNARLQEEVRQRTRSEERQKRLAEELLRSNNDLEQFAYIASHDLQEPLRMMSSYVDLLADRYRGQIDEKADRWIGFVVDASARMKQLINDLLEYSRVGRRGKPFEPADCGALCATAITNLGHAIRESGARIICGPLPKVAADATQLTQVFQNLIGNALKYHGPSPPEVHIAADRQPGQWVFLVRDNGIGIAPEHAERIFELFRRLHSRQEYPGTGIGLTLCKRIIERHGGRIWVESRPGEGATFFFTLPDRGGD